MKIEARNFLRSHRFVTKGCFRCNRCVIPRKELLFQPVAEVQIAPKASATGIPSEPYGANLHQRDLTDSIAGSDAILLRDSHIVKIHVSLCLQVFQ